MYKYTGKTVIESGRMKVEEKDLHKLPERALSIFESKNVIEKVKKQVKNGKETKSD